MAVYSVKPPYRLSGQLTVPGDKSISHRAIIFNSLARGSARITNFLRGADCLATIRCMRALGVSVEDAGDEVQVHGVGDSGLSEPVDVLDAANSGTTMRLLTGLLSAQPFLSVLTGDNSLRSRPMKRVIAPLTEMGAEIHGRGGNNYAPLAIVGAKLKGIDFELPVASAQLKSALIIAGLFAEGPTRLTGLIHSRDHTERMLKSMGVDLEVREDYVRVSPGKRLGAVDIIVPGDCSSAAFWLVAGAIHPHAEITVTGMGLNPSRTGLLDVLEEMGAKMVVENRLEIAGEPVGDVVVKSSALRGGRIDEGILPRLIDEVPILSVAALLAEGDTVIEGAAELRVKESDRLHTVATELGKLGAEIEERPDGLTIRGGKALHGAPVESHGDHRLAMALAVAGLVADGQTSIGGAECVDVSYPGFWADLETLGR